MPPSQITTDAATDRLAVGIVRVAAQRSGDDLWDPSWIESSGEATIRRRQSVRSATTISEDPSDRADNAPPPPVVDLYCSWFCPFAQRAWIALEEHGVPYEYVEVNPYEVDPTELGGYTKKALSLDEKKARHPDFVAVSPRGLVPAIRHRRSDLEGDDNEGRCDDRGVWDSIHVTEYVDSVWGEEGATLVPRDDPYRRALVGIWTSHCTERIQKAFYAALMEPDPSRREATLRTFLDECRALAGAMDETGPYFSGERFSLVDVALAPFWQRFVSVGRHYANLRFPEDEPAFDRLGRWWEATRARPSVAATFVCEARLIASYSQYSRNVATSDVAKNVRGESSSSIAEQT